MALTKKQLASVKDGASCAAVLLGLPTAADTARSERFVEALKSGRLSRALVEAGRGGKGAAGYEIGTDAADDDAADLPGDSTGGDSVDDVEPDLDVEPVNTADPVSDALSGGFKAALQALIDDDSLDAAAKIVRMSKLLKAHEELTAKEVAEARRRPFAGRTPARGL